MSELLYLCANFYDMHDKIYLSLAHLSGAELAYVQAAFDENWVTTAGRNLDDFENALNRFLGNKSHALALYSGTAALHLALILLNVDAGDEVICQTFTYAASANPVLYQRATPVFVDSEPDTWNMSPDFLGTAIADRIKITGKKPKAIIPVHLYGMPARMDEIRTIADHYGIPIIEDAAESLGSTYKSKHCGTLGDMAAISFNGNKIITTSGGGVLVSANEQLMKDARYLATQARDAAPHYQHSQIGYNYRMSNILAGIGCAQMTVLPQRIEQRRAINQLYRTELANISAIRFQTEPSADYYSNYWLTAIEIDPQQSGGITRETLRLALEAENIESRPVWKPMHLQPVFQQMPYYGDRTSEKIFEAGLCLPSSSILKKEDILYITNVIKQVFNI